MSKPPFRDYAYAEPKVEVERRGDGSVILRSGYPLGTYEDHVLRYLERWNAQDPGRLFLAQRRPDRSWQTLSYGEAWRQARAVGQALLDRGLGPERPVMILSGNSIEHALMTLGAMMAGVPAAPVSPAYSLMSEDFGKLRHVRDLVDPGLVFVQDAGPFARALEALALTDVEVVAAKGEGTPLAELLAATPGAVLEAAYRRLGPDTVAKYLFTSGSTGLPKGVINTQRMMCANQVMAQTYVPPEPDEPTVIVDWLPWNHTFGGNMNFNGVMATGGTMYIDAGRPVPGLFEETLANIREISPTSFLNVPAGYAMLADRLEKDEALAQAFFRRVKRCGYGGAALPQELFERFQQIAIRTTGRRIVFYTGWGCTETAPTATSAYWPSERVGLIGIPYPGVELKMVQAGDKYELRLRGPIVFPGYLKRPDLTEAAFDEEGFYRIGDAGSFVDPERPERGLVFGGRVTEDFKLDTGTWVNAGPLRLHVLDAVSPVLQDAVVCGHDRGYVAVLAWPNEAAAKEVAADLRAGDDIDAICASADLAAFIRDGLCRYNRHHPGSSTRVRRVMLMREPPSIDANEITDKGYINQRAALERRADLVKQLYRDPPPAGIIEIGD